MNGSIRQSKNVPASLERLVASPECALYTCDAPKQISDRVTSLVASTPETRAIANDPFVFGTRYTDSLGRACHTVLRALQRSEMVSLRERDTTVLQILRGGLNFGLREALSSAFGWNRHRSAFLSAQRARIKPASNDWIITEGAYKKLALRPRTSIIFGDVVATGTSLQYALNEVASAARQQRVQITDIVFFTIGGWRSSEVLIETAEILEKDFPGFRRAVVIYFEGIFGVADESSPLRIKLTGTDLLRRDGLFAPEFVESQAQNPAYPLERCSIYDAGSRAFDVDEYLADVAEYWRKVQALASDGLSYREYLAERMPLSSPPATEPNLLEVARERVERLEDLLRE